MPIPPRPPRQWCEFYTRGFIQPELQVCSLNIFNHETSCKIFAALSPPSTRFGSNHPVSSQPPGCTSHGWSLPRTPHAPELVPKMLLRPSTKGEEGRATHSGDRMRDAMSSWSSEMGERASERREATLRSVTQLRHASRVVLTDTYHRRATSLNDAVDASAAAANNRPLQPAPRQPEEDATSRASTSSLLQLFTSDPSTTTTATTTTTASASASATTRAQTLDLIAHRTSAAAVAASAARAGNDDRDHAAGSPTSSSSCSRANVERQRHEAYKSDLRRRGGDDEPAKPRPAGGWDAALFAVCTEYIDNHEEEEDEHDGVWYRPLVDSANGPRTKRRGSFNSWMGV